MPDRTVAVVQARMGSARLPGKSLRPVAGVPLIEHVLRRAAAIPGVDDVVLATTLAPRDDELASWVASRGWAVARGDEADVLARVWFAARLARADAVVRLTGDCPLLCPATGGLVLDAFRDGRASDTADYAWNDTARSGYPDGTDVEVFTRAALEAADWQARRREDREHVTTWMRAHLRVRVVLSPGEDWSRLKLSVDRPEDYDRVCRIAAHLDGGGLTLADTLAAARAAGVLSTGP